MQRKKNNWFDISFSKEPDFGSPNPESRGLPAWGPQNLELWLSLKSTLRPQQSTFIHSRDYALDVV